jgi:hypothetical protein
MVADPLFSFGFSITLLGILQKKVGQVACGLVIAAFGRQTALAIMLATWIALFFDQSDGKFPIYLVISASAAVAVIYWAGGWFADGAVNENVDHLTGFVVWLFEAQPDKIRHLIDFGARGLVSQNTAVTLLIVLSATRLRPLSVNFWIIALFVLSVWSQPVLGGPEVTGNNIGRLGSLAYVGLLAMVAIVAREIGKNLTPWATWSIAIALVSSSFHHRWSWPGYVLFQTPQAFAIVATSTAVLAGIAAYLGNKVALSSESSDHKGEKAAYRNWIIF